MIGINLDSIEWYDNSRLSTIDACHRKGFWNTLFTKPGSDTPGLEASVGAAAKFGTAIHEALGTYYGLQLHGVEEPKRRAAAFRKFSELHEKLLMPLALKRNHELARGLQLLDLYFAHYLTDSGIKPVEVELAGVYPITPRPDEEFEQFYYAWKADMIIERINYGDWMIFETKTTSGNIESKIQDLQLSRQIEGYAYSANQYDPSKTIVGALVNVIATLASEMRPDKLFRRDYNRLSQLDLERWRKETINKVQYWRWIKSKAMNKGLEEALLLFDRRTDECSSYGRCPYIDLCTHGVQGVNMDDYLPNKWSPLNQS